MAGSRPKHRDNNPDVDVYLEGNQSLLWSRSAKVEEVQVGVGLEPLLQARPVCVCVCVRESVCVFVCVCVCGY